MKKAEKRNVIMQVRMMVILLCVLTVSLSSCHENVSDDNYPKTEYAISVHCLPLEIKDWQVIGAFSLRLDSLLDDSLIRGWSDTLVYVNPDTLQKYWFCGSYHPKYDQLDLREIYGTTSDEKMMPLDSMITYMSCKLTANQDMDLYLEVKKNMKCWQFLNGDTLHKRDIQGLNLYPIHLRKGVNDYVIKAMGKGNDYSLEVAVYDSVGVARLYADGQTGNIVYTEVLNNTIMITNAHQRVTGETVKLQFHDVYGNLVNETILVSDTFVYHIPELEPNVSYVCSMIMSGDTVRQAVLNGTIDDVRARLGKMCDSVPLSHPRKKELEQVLYRFDFLLNHPTRYDGDWWWQFKIGAIAYQMEHVLAHVDETYGDDENEYNVKFITYESILDGGSQRYVIVTPNKMDKSVSYPLVVVVRPNSVNLHHLFACPQIARQWAVNIMQSFADNYGYVIIMPEARMSLDEELTPMADREMMLAIDDVKSHYSVDEKRIYLHANCSGGYRALQLAERHPNTFAAIGLYAPMYQCETKCEWSALYAPGNAIDILKSTPIFVFGDPLDSHSPPSFYKDLLEDGRKHGLSIEFGMKRNSGMAYNIMVVGKEAFDFFNGKIREGIRTVHATLPKTRPVIADFYSNPFVYVYNSSDHTKSYRNLIDSICCEYESYMFSDLPLVADTSVTATMLEEKNVFFIGDKYSNPLLNDRVSFMRRGRRSEHDLISVYESPVKNGKLMIEYNTSLKIRFKRVRPWRRCVSRVVAVYNDM